MINHDDVEKLINELTKKMFVLGEGSIETDSFYILVFTKSESED